jgi:hypothetical protein
LKSQSFLDFEGGVRGFHQERIESQNDSERDNEGNDWHLQKITDF